MTAKEKYGIKVHSSYIAEVKRMCGVSMQAKRSKENTKYKVFKATPKMVDAIKDALMFYGII